MSQSRRRAPRLTYVLRCPDAAARRAHCAGVNALLLSPDGRSLFSASRDATVRRWAVGDLAGSGARSAPKKGCDACFEGHTDWVTALTWLPGAGGALLASASCDTTVRLWRADAKPASAPGAPPAAPLATLRGAHKDYVTSLAAHAHVPLFASGGLGGEVFLWDAATARAVAAAGAPSLAAAAAPRAGASVYALAMAAGAAPSAAPLLVAGGAERTLRVFDTRQPAAPAAELRGHTDTVRAAALDAGGLRCVSAGADRVLRLWDLRKMLALGCIPPAHADSVWALAADEALGTVWSGGRDGQLWCASLAAAAAAAPSTLLAAPRGGEAVTALCLAGGGGIWVGTTGSSIALWPRDAGAAPAGAAGGAAAAAAAASSPQQQPPSFRGVRPAAPPATPRHAAPRATLLGAPGLRRAEVLPDRRRILTQDAAGELAIWDIAAAAPVTRVPPPALPPPPAAADGAASGASAASAAFEAARAAQEAAIRVAAPAWFGVDVRTGELAIHLDPPGVFSAEAYASEYGLADAGDDAKINLGQQALLCCLGPWARARAQVEGAAAAGSADAGEDDGAGNAAEPPVMPPPSAFAFPSPPPVLVFDGPDGVRHRWDASAVSGSDAEAEALPAWAADAALRGKLPDGGGPTKMAFHLHPAEGSPYAPLAQSKLNAPRILRASKIAGYLASELELPLPGGDVARATELLELTCAGQVVPWDMTLATAAAFLWRRPMEELTIHYAPRGAGRLRGRP